MVMLNKIRYWIDYFLPREVMGPVLIVFSLEMIVDILFQRYLPSGVTELMGWVSMFIISVGLVAWWGLEDDEDMEEFGEKMEDNK